MEGVIRAPVRYNGLAMKQKRTAIIRTLAVLLGVSAPWIVSATQVDGGHGSALFMTTILWVGVLLLLARVFSLVRKLHLPSVFGELLLGIILGNLALVGWNVADGLPQNELILFIAEVGAIILLFQAGLESNVREMRQVGGRALAVALVGVAAPFVLGTYVVGPWLLPGLDIGAYLLLGAALSATSVGITARVFKDMRILDSREAKIVMGAAVIDDVLGLVLLSVIGAFVTTGVLSPGAISWIVLESVVFLVGSIVLGQLLAPLLGAAFSRIQTGVGMKFTLAISLCLLFAYAASLIGLAPIIGAFAAGLILEPVHFSYFREAKIVSDIKRLMKGEPRKLKKEVSNVLEKHTDHHVEELIKPLAFFFVPIFFISMGLGVDLAALVQPQTLLVAGIISVVAIAGKLAAGFFAGPKVNKWLIGVGLVPRGEVGLIFAAFGLGLGIIDDVLFSIIVATVVITTFIAPLVMARLKPFK